MAKNEVTACKQTPPLYRECLEPIERARYISKLKLIEGNDPYELKTWSNDVKLLPKITYPDIVNYLVFSPSPYTLEDLKSYKGLEAYNQLVSGWVREISTVIINNRHVVKAKILHSQRLREKPLMPWLIVEEDGKVVGAHCNCMAGLGEACTHIGALLFAVEGTVKVRDSRTVTQEPAYWMLQSATKVSYSETRDINFTSAKSLKKRFDDACINAGTPVKKPIIIEHKKNNIPEPTAAEMTEFYKRLHQTGVKSAILSLVPPYADEYIPTSINQKYPKVLTELRDEKTFNLNYKDLLDKCSHINIVVSAEEANAVELATREQANSKMWFSFRSGRITALKMKAVCATDSTNPSQSLVKAVCYPGSQPFKSVATKWGCDHEKIACDKFLEQLNPFHESVVIQDSGLVISTDKPYIAASPDGIVSCDCCGQSCVEVKCPFCKKDQTLSDCNDPKFFLKPAPNRQMQLDRKHAYYYQIQTQMGATKLEACYFIVWTERNIHIERIMFDDCLWQEMCSKSEKVFQLAVLPEPVGKFYSRLPTSSSPLATLPCDSIMASNATCSKACKNRDEETWCYCGQVESGKTMLVLAKCIHVHKTF